MRKIIILLLSFCLCVSFGFMMTGCSSNPSEEPEEIVEEEPEEGAEEEPNEEGIDDAESEQQYEDDDGDSAYDDSAQYIKSEEVIDGDGYSVVVDNSIKGDFTKLQHCAMYSMKKAYGVYETLEIGVFGSFEDGETAFAYDSNWDNKIYLYEDWVTPPGWEWELFSQDYAYIKGE